MHTISVSKEIKDRAKKHKRASVAMPTVSVSKEEALEARRWFIVDAENKVLGRLCTEIASVLRGKRSPGFTPHTDCGDFVIVINAEKVRLTGDKENKKLYHHHTGWVGGVVSKTASQMRAAHPERMIEIAVKGMLPKGTLGRATFKKLKVYKGSEHPHGAQQPQELIIAA